MPLYPIEGSLHSTTSSCPISAIVSNSFIKYCSGETSGVSVQSARDHDSLDLRRALINLGDFRIAHKALHRIILDVAISAEDLHRLRRHPHRRLARHQLRHRAELADALSAILRRCRGVEERSRAGHTHRHIRELELDRLELLDCLSELLSLAGVDNRVLECCTCNADRLGGDAEPSIVERLHCV